MSDLNYLEKKINSELTTKVKKTEIKHGQIFIEIDKEDIIDVILFLNLQVHCWTNIHQSREILFLIGKDNTVQMRDLKYPHFCLD